MEIIRDQGSQIDLLIIKGHGTEESVDLSENGDYLTVYAGIHFGNYGDPDYYENVTQLMNDITDANSTISLRGCFTRPLAKKLDTALGGAPTVSGAVRFVINIPGTSWGIFFWNNF